MFLGMVLAALGGAADASMALVMSFANRWRWENIWFVWAIFGCLLLPWVTVFLLLPHPLEIYRNVPTESLVNTVLFGAGWGLGALLYGLGVVRVGMGLGLGIVVSLTAANGALWPLIQNHRELLLTPPALILYLAVAILILGIVLCSLAAEQRKEERPLLARESTGLATGILCCVLSGFTSPMINLAFTEGIGITNLAASQGAGPLASGMAPVAPIMTGGFVVNAIYCLRLLVRNRSWNEFHRRDTVSHWWYGIFMGALQMTGFLLYTIAATRIDRVAEFGGTVLGWPIYTAAALMIGNLEGLWRGEWHGSDQRTFALLGTGMTGLVISSATVIALACHLSLNR